MSDILPKNNKHKTRDDSTTATITLIFQHRADILTGQVDETEVTTAERIRNTLFMIKKTREKEKEINK